MRMRVAGYEGRRSDTAALFRPLALAGTELPNRVMSSAMTLQYGEDGLMSERHQAIYEERARGGVGLMFSEQITASPLSDSAYAPQMRGFDPRQVEAYAALARRLEPYPARFFVQLFCAGVVSASTAGLEGWGPVRGPSRIGTPGGEEALPLRPEELAQIARDFAGSASFVKAGGLDGVEIHGAHGWLVGQFLSPYYNQRDDAYGGSVENRCRLALEIGAAIRAAVGAAFPVGIALTYDELIGDAGITKDDTLAQLEVLLAADVFDFFDLSIGAGAHSEHFTIAPMSVEEGFALDFAGRARELAAGRAAIFVAGRITDPRMAAAAVRDGAADVVAMSRAQLADPALVRKARQGRLSEIRRCVATNVCVGRALAGEPVACVLTPATGREVDGWRHGDLPIVAARDRRKILIVGAGPAGLRAGAIAAARGHEVTVYDRRVSAGGHLWGLAALPTRQGWGHAVEDLLAELARAGARLRLDTEVTPAVIERDAPDQILLASGAGYDTDGAAGLRPSGFEVRGGGRVVGFDAALALARGDLRAFGRAVVIADDTGAYPPLGLAELLARAGVTVTFLTARPEIGAGTAFNLELLHLKPRLLAVGVVLETDTTVRLVDGGSVEVEDVWAVGSRRLEGIDTVVTALRRRPRLELAEYLDGSGREWCPIGDALTPRSTIAAIEEAERVALSI